MILGIDLGTTNSLAAIWRDGAPVLVPNALGQVLTPSVVSLDKTGEILVGVAARDRLSSHPQLSVAAFKRSMGTSREFQLGPRRFRAEELSAFVLRALKADAEAFLGQPVEEAVITVPAYFNDAQRKATRIAGELAELKVERLLNEPTAAALAYGLQARAAGRDGKILVFDLGGGTFDVSLLDCFDGVMEVRASTGDNYLGGEDFVDAIVAWFLDEIGAPLPDPAALPAWWGTLRRQAEQAKRRLTDAAETEIELIWDSRTRRARLSRERFAALAEPLLQRLRRPIERALQDARIRPAALSEIVLAGGATRMPMIRRLTAQLFGRLPLVQINPDEVVACGAAVQAGLKQRDAALREVVLTDVAPYTLGVEVVDEISPGNANPGRFLPVIERNTVVPASRTKRVNALHDYQTKVVVPIYQGESRLVKDNIFLGTLRLDLTPAPARDQVIDIRFSYDINGLLEVSATSVLSGKRERVVIESNPGVLSPAEIETRLAALTQFQILPRDRAEHRALIARAERVYQERLGEQRQQVGQETSLFEAALDRQDPAEIAAAANRLTDFLRRLEPSTS
jgi:molecular chaperone HscC